MAEEKKLEADKYKEAEEQEEKEEEPVQQK